MNDYPINIRRIQHYYYCKRQWGLLEIDDDWAENAFVVKANLIHENVHDGSHRFSDQRRIVRSNVAIYNDLPEYNLYGIADCVEFVRDSKGVGITGLPDRYAVRLVEYKPTAPRKGGESDYSEADALQVFAQKLCADFVWGCNSECFIYYSDVRKRVRLPLDSEYDDYDRKIKGLLAQMREDLRENRIEPCEDPKKCSGCSMKDCCFPKIRRYSVRHEIEKLREEEPL